GGGDAPDAVALREVLLLQLRGGVAKGRRAVLAPARLLQDLARDVRRVHAQVAARLEPRLEREHHDRVGLLPARAARGPDAYRRVRVGRPAAAQLGEDLFDERAQLIALAKEVGLVRS